MKFEERVIELLKNKELSEEQKNKLEEIFSELSESEDERIRKALIEHIKGIYKDSCTEEISKERDMFLAWLEKQSTDIFSFPKEQQVFMQKYVSLDKITLIKLLAERDANNAEIIESFEKQGEQSPIKEHNVCDFCEDRYGCVNPCPVKLIEQKPTDKIEPKFKIGDWVIGRATSNEPRQISEIIDQYYKSTYGGQYGFSFEDEMHLWTIQDAKDGDVLSNETTVFIFKDLLSDGSIMSYCDYNTDSDESDAFCSLSMNLMCSKITPTTKEQRDALMKAMADAGYTFDFEKKELKKIEQKKDMHIKLTDFEYSLKHIMEEAIECGDTHNLKADADILLRLAQKPDEWSEEDEFIRLALLKIVKNEMKQHGNVGLGNGIITSDIIAWLKKQGKISGSYTI